MSYQATEFVIELDGLTPQQKAVAHVLAFHADKNGANSYPAMERIARESGFRSKRGAQKIMRELETKRVILPLGPKTGGRGRDKATVYAFNFAYVPSQKDEQPFTVSEDKRVNSRSRFSEQKARTVELERANGETGNREQVDAKERTSVHPNSHEESKKSNEKSGKIEHTVQLVQDDSLFGVFQSDDSVDYGNIGTQNSPVAQDATLSSGSYTKATPDLGFYDQDDQSDPSYKPDTHDQSSPVIQTVSSIDQLKHIVSRISKGKFDTSYLDSYEHTDQLLACCEEATALLEHNARKGAINRRPADEMGTAMEMLRSRYEFDVPRGWVPVMKQLREEAKARRIPAPSTRPATSATDLSRPSWTQTDECPL